MRTFAKLFGKSPFIPLQAHMEKVAVCVRKVGELFDAFNRHDHDAVDALAAEISDLEHQADQVKYDIQGHLPRSLFLAVDRDRLLEILAVQDSIADKAENIGVLLTLKRITMFDTFRDKFDAFLKKNLDAFDGVNEVIHQLDELLETGFGGGEAEKVMQMVDIVARREYEADLIQRDLLKTLFASEDRLSVGDFFLWSRLLEQISDLSNLSERLANRVRRILELKK